MKRKDINDYISYKLWGYSGNSLTYDCYINEEYIGGSSDLRRKAKENDQIKIEMFTGRYNNMYHTQTVRFVIKNDQKAIEEYRKLNNKFSPLRDNQRSKVYAAERRMIKSFGETEKLDPDQCQELANEIWNDYGFESNPPTVIVSNAKKRYSTSSRWNATIKLAAGWGQAKKVVLHEIAHQIIDNGYKYPDPGHGKYFTAILLELYEMYLGWNHSIMLDCFAKHNCKIANQSELK